MMQASYQQGLDKVHMNRQSWRFHPMAILCSELETEPRGFTGSVF